MSALQRHTTRLSKHICTLPVLIGVIAVLPYTSLLLSGDLVFADSPYCDYTSFQVPMREFAQREFLSGRFPHWNPWVGCGIPMHATQQLAVCYPLLTPFLFLFSANMATKVAILLHVILCYVGQNRLARKLRVTSTGSAISGLILAQSGFLTSHLAVGHVAMVLHYGILPWFFLSVVTTCRRPSWVASLGFATTVAGMLLIGNPQVPYYALLIGGLWTAGSLLCGAAAARRSKVIAHFSLSLVIALLLAAVQLAPAIELAQDNRGLSERGTREYAEDYALDCVDVYRLFFPSMRGNPLVEIPEFQPPDFYHEKTCYLGIITWIFIFYGIVHPTSDRWPRAASLLSMFALIVSLGPTTPLFAAIGNVVPGLFLFRCPGRCLGVSAVLLGLLAARGFDLLCTANNQRFRPSQGRVIALVLVADAVLMFLIDRTIDRFDWTRWAQFAEHQLLGEMQMSLAALLASVIFALRNRRASESVRCLIAVIIIVTDLGYFNIRGVRYQIDDVQPLPPSVLAEGQQFRFVEGPHSLHFSKDAVRYSRFVPQAVRSQVRMLGTNEGGVLPAACEVLFRALQDEPVETLQQSSCRHVVTNARHFSERTLDATLPRSRFTPISTVNDEILVDVLTDESQLLTAQIDTPVSGEFVVADTFYPGWIATVDGVRSNLHCVNGCFRGLHVPAGQHLIQMQFQSASFSLGCHLTAVGLAGLAALMWLAVRDLRKINFLSRQVEA